ncbi:MAG: acyl-ACP desaturase [Deltaproteobacteria bacterium]
MAIAERWLETPSGARMERSFKSLLRYVAAINQSPAKALLDPVYEKVADALVREVPLSARLREARYEENLFPAYLARSHKLRYDIHTFDFDEARPELLSSRQRAFVHSAALGETSGFAVGASFLSSFRSSPELGSFFGVWFLEELNHYWGYHRYLERMGEGWGARRKEDVTAVDFRPYSSDPMEVAAANLYQELVGYLVYRSVARQAGDPFFARMIDRFAKDELRHYKFYQSVVAREIQRNPDFRAIALKHFLKATTPVNQVAGGARATVDHLTRASFYFRKPEYEFLLREMEFLFGTNLSPLFAFFYRRHVPPCERCGVEVYLCGCARFDPPAPN